MLSRVAERMYWAGRYLERAENTARLVKVHGHMLLDLPPQAGHTWEQLLTIFNYEQAFAKRYAEASEANIIGFFVADTTHAGSIISSLASLRENIRTTRDIIPTEGWECVNELHLFARDELSAGSSEQTTHQVLSQVISRCQQLTGLLAGTMSNGQGYSFLRLGRNLERADMTTRIIDVPATTLLYAPAELEPFKYTLWMNVLKSLSGYQMYCQYVRRRVVGEDVIDFLLHDTLFPRSVRTCLGELLNASQALPRHAPVSRELQKLDEILQAPQAEMAEARDLHQHLDSLQLQLGKVHSSIATSWFILAD